MNKIHYRPGIYGHGHRKECNCNDYNFYKFPKPEPRKMRRLDCTGIRIHTDKFVGEDCFSKGQCCEPVPVKVQESVKSLIIEAATECLEPATYYTLEISHPLPDDIFAQPAFVQVEKCGLFQDPVKLVYTETTFPMCEFDGYPKCAIPADPAFPDQDIPEFSSNEGIATGEVPVAYPNRIDGRHKNHETRLIPVELDLHGNTAFGSNFVKGISPHSQTMILFYTNRGTFSLCRTWKRLTDY